MAENDFATNGNDGMAMVHKMEFEQNGVWVTHDSMVMKPKRILVDTVENQW
jgi:hypothetical protein